MNRDLAEVVDQVVDIAERTGRLQLERRGSLVVRGTKAHLNDLVSDVDLASEQLITDAITAAWPDDGILVLESPSSTLAMRNRLRLNIDTGSAGTMARPDRWVDPDGAGDPE